MYTFNDVRMQSVSHVEFWISEIEMKLEYTKKTVRRNALKKELSFWKKELCTIKKLINDN